MADTSVTSYKVWDVPVRLFHWINFLSVLALIAFGLVIYNGGALGLSNEGKVLMKTLHVWTGYVFAVNLAIRLVWAFMGNAHARWSAILPGGRGYGAALRAYIRGDGTAWLGHNPLGRMAVTAMLLALLGQAVTGLVLAGTDIYYPPFGGMIAEWIAADGVDPASLVPYGPKELLDAAAYQDMRAFRKPYIEVHEWLFFTLLGLIALHIAAVVMAEIRHGGTLVSAMFTGRKHYDRTPEDEG